MYKKYGKRLLDIMLSVIGIVVLAIPMLIIAIAIKIDSPGPAIFKQKRVGLHKKEFTILKFRSMPMTVRHDLPTHEFKDEDLLSPFQRAMRRYSLDELPQLFCILMSSMAIIGPRPALPNQTDLIAERDKYGANGIKPGLTGWAQINGRDELPIDVKARLDGEYVEKESFLFDLKCFFLTITSVLKHQGVVEGGVGTEEQYKDVVYKD